MLRLNYHHLLYFREIAICGSISKAAFKLRIGQPALSAQLKTFEENIGYRLFERVHRRLILTDAGRLALQSANEIFSSGNALVDAVEKGVLASRIEVRIGVLDSVPKHLIMNLIREAHNTGECHVTITEGHGDELLRELNAHSLDLLVTNFRARSLGAEEIFNRALGKSEISIFGAPRFKDLRKGFPQSVENQPLILPTNDSQLRHDIDHYFRSNNLRVDIFAETQDTSVQKLVAAEGLALLPLPNFSAKELVREKKLVNIGLLKGVWEEFWIISIRRTIDNPVVSRLSRDFQFSFEM